MFFVLFSHLFVTDLPQDVRQFIHEEHPNAQRFSDGDIYQNIRISQTQGNVDAEIKWRGRLPGRVKKELDRMEKDFKRIQRGMDNLLPFKGLWNSLKLSYLGRWLSIKCPEARRTVHYCIFLFLTRVDRKSSTTLIVYICNGVQSCRTILQSS